MSISQVMMSCVCPVLVASAAYGATIVDTEPNGSAAQAQSIQMGDVMTGMLPGFDKDWYAFEAQEGYIHTFVAVPTCGSLPTDSIMDVYLQIYNPAADAIIDSVPPGGNCLTNTLHFTAPATASYYVRVLSKALPPPMDAVYTVTTSVVPPPTPTPLPRDVADLNADGCTNIDDFLLMLDYWGTEYQGVVVGLTDFLALLDNWQAGPACL